MVDPNPPRHRKNKGKNTHTDMTFYSKNRRRDMSTQPHFWYSPSAHTRLTRTRPRSRFHVVCTTSTAQEEEWRRDRFEEISLVCVDIEQPRHFVLDHQTNMLRLSQIHHVGSPPTIVFHRANNSAGNSRVINFANRSPARHRRATTGCPPSCPLFPPQSPASYE